MMVFSGNIKQSIQDEIIKRRSRQAGIMLSVCAVIGLLYVFIVTLITREFDGEIITTLVCSSVLLVLSFILFIKPGHYRAPRWNYIIKFEAESIVVILAHQNYVEVTKPLKKIKKVLNYGEYYYINFNRWDTSNGIVCQKDLLIEGTIDEFEHLFKDKIVCKRKKNKY